MLNMTETDYENWRDDLRCGGQEEDDTQGTLYPLLLRLERKGLIAAEYRAGSGGPSRKYYRLTPDGVQYLNEFTEAWQNASDTVNRILHDKEG